MTSTESFHAQIYRRLLAAYPPAFRARYQDEMVQLFVDQLRDAETGAAGSRTGHVWFRAIRDLAATSLSERVRNERTVGHSLPAGPPTSSRLLGLLGVVGGLLLVAALLPNVPWTSELFNLRLVVFNIGAVAVAAAVLRRQPVVSRRPLLAVVVPVVLANAWYLALVMVGLGRPQFPEPDPEFRLVMFLAGVAMWWSDTAFALVAWRLKAATRWGALALAIGSVLAFVGMDRLDLVQGDLGWLFTPLALAGIALNGLGWILLGFDVAFRRTAPPSRRRTTPSQTT